MDFSVGRLAARQLADYRARTPGTFFAEEDRPHLSLDDAYAVQAEVARLRAAEGEPVAGYKVGATGAGVREQFGMDGPIRGLLYGTELYPSGAELSHASYANLAIEGELAVRLGDDAEIARIFPVIELHNYVFRSETPNLQELIANNGVHAGVAEAKPASLWPRFASTAAGLDGDASRPLPRAARRQRARGGGAAGHRRDDGCRLRPLAVVDRSRDRGVSGRL
jgi:2-keto-4-pentenoate hydratase